MVDLRGLKSLSTEAQRKLKDLKLKITVNCELGRTGYMADLHGSSHKRKSNGSHVKAIAETTCADATRTQIFIEALNNPFTSLVQNHPIPQ